MKIKNSLYIAQVTEQMEIDGEAEVVVPAHEMMSVLGSTRLMGFHAFVLPNGNMKVEPKRRVLERGRPTGLIYGVASTLLEEQGDPTTMEVDNTAKVQSSLRYHGIYSSKIDRTHLMISREPIVKEGLKVIPDLALVNTDENLDETFPELIKHLNEELPFVEVVESAQEAKSISDRLRSTYGRLLLLKIVQLGTTVVLEYKKVLPTELPKDYPDATVFGWAKALSNSISPDQGYLHYNAHARKFGRELMSKKGFERLLNG